MALANIYSNSMNIKDFAFSDVMSFKYVPIKTTSPSGAPLIVFGLLTPKNVTMLSELCELLNLGYSVCPAVMLLGDLKMHVNFNDFNNSGLNSEIFMNTLIFYTLLISVLHVKDIS